MKIATFNINSIRVRQETLLGWLQEDGIDLVALQETKVQDKDFPAEFFQNAGYQLAYLGEKSKNGVALISKMPLENISFGLDKVGLEGEARLIKAEVNGFKIINTYVPQGREAGSDYFFYKLSWLRGVRAYLERHFQPSEKVIWLGDINVAADDRDVYEPERHRGQVCFHPDEQAALSYVKEWGLSDAFRQLVPEAGNYSFWDYRIPNALKRGLGWRIDHIYATEPLAKEVKNAYVAKHLRLLPKPSDHAPVVIEI